MTTPHTLPASCPGFLSTASCQSSLTYLDGAKGELLYRGYPIEQLAEKSSFTEVAYLMLYGELPGGDELKKFNDVIIEHSMLNESLSSLFGGFYHDAHPMAILSSVVNAMSTFYQDSLDPNDPEQVNISVVRLLAKLPTIAAAASRSAVPVACVTRASTTSPASIWCPGFTCRVRSCTATNACRRRCPKVR